MAKRTDEADDFRIRPNRPRSGGKSEARAWSTALRTVLRYAGTSRRSKASTNSGSGGFAQAVQPALRRTYHVHSKQDGGPMEGPWTLHCARERGRRGSGPLTYGRGTGDMPLDPAKELERWQSEGDPRMWKLIVSPEFGERLDLDQLTRDLMTRMEKDLGTKLEWVAVTHFNTEHPHVHVALRGIRDDKSALDLPRDYVRHGIRAIAEDLCTGNWDIVTIWMHESERREIQERRFTSLDRVINRANAVEVADSG